MRQTEYTGVNLFNNAEEGVKMNSEKWMTLNDPTERIVYACNPSGMNFSKCKLVILLAVCVSIGLSANGDDSLVVPQDVSWTLKQIGLTRSLEGVSGGNKIVRNQSQNSTVSESVRENGAKSAEKGDSADHAQGWSAEGNVNAGVKWGVVPTLSAEGSVGGKKNSNRSDYSKNSTKESEESAKEKSKQNVDGNTSEGLEEEKYGSYHLQFSLALKSSNPADTFKVCATNAKIRLLGLSIPVVVPCRHPEFVLDAEERILDFDYPVEDQALLRDLVAIANQGAWQRMNVSLAGYEFPIISEATGKNVISEMKIAEQNSPTTEISVQFGDVARLSPWRVKRRYGRSSGKRGKLVSVRDALIAINGLVAQNDEMPEQVFEFDKDGGVQCVCDVPFVQKPTERNLKMIGVRCDGDDNMMKVHPLSSEFLETPLSAFRKIEFMTVELADVAAAVSNDNGLTGLRNEISKFVLEIGALDVWKNLVSNSMPKADCVVNKKTGNTVKDSEEKNAKVNLGRMTVYGTKPTVNFGGSIDIYKNDQYISTVKYNSSQVVEDVCEGDLFRFEQSELGIKITGRYRVGKLLYDLYLDTCKSFMAIEVEELKKGK